MRSVKIAMKRREFIGSINWEGKWKREYWVISHHFRNYIGDFLNYRRRPALSFTSEQ